jgi:glycoside hydrolase family 2 gh2E
MRRTYCINDYWTFVKEGIEEKVNLPHTWNAKDGQTGPAPYYRGECVYKKEFVKPESDRGEEVYIEFRGVNSSARVMINGKEAGRHDGGYSTFRVNITDKLEPDNIMEVYVNNLPNDRVYPQKADFTFYGGIYRDVYMIITDSVHFDMDDHGGNGFYITPHLCGKDASVTFETYITGKADKVMVSVEGIGETELSLTKVKNEENKISFMGQGAIIIHDVHRWNGLDDPYLYKATATVYNKGEEVDRVSDKFGCREYSFDPEKGFFLNGKSYPLHGVSRHQDRAVLGNALTKEMHKEDMDLIISMGANSIRLAHYQHDQYFYDLCDEKGMIVWAEIPYITVHLTGGRENTIEQMKELIIQNYNHASIICWAISNEITLQGVTEDLLENHRILNELIHKMDPGRVSAMANLFLLETDSPLVSLPDIRGYNLYYGWYVGEVTDNDAWFDEFHSKYPNTVIGLTEYGADSVINIQSPKPEKGDYSESYQALYHEHMLEMFSKRPYLWGTYCWNMFEFAAAGRDEAGDPGKNHKGLITFDRKIKKDAYYIYKAWWTKEPFVHLCGKRYHDRIEDVTEIKIYSNQKKVVLYVDDRETATLTGEHVFKFDLPIYGKHKIKVIIPEINISDETEIEKVSEPNPAYFASKDKVKNWFDEDVEETAKEDGYLSINSTMAEIQAVPEGAAIVNKIMEQMQKNTAGGMGANVKISPAMQAMIARQPLKKLLQQGGMDIDSESFKNISEVLSKIKKL